MKNKQLLPDPPLASLPELSEGLRWEIEPPNAWEKNDLNPRRRVNLQKRVEKRKWFWQAEPKVEWVTVETSVWNVREGFGNLSTVTPENWHRHKGLANTIGYILVNVRENANKPKAETYDNVYGVSKF